MGGLPNQTLFFPSIKKGSLSRQPFGVGFSPLRARILDAIPRLSRRLLKFGNFLGHIVNWI